MIKVQEIKIDEGIKKFKPSYADIMEIGHPYIYLYMKDHDLNKDDYYDLLAVELCEEANKICCPLNTELNFMSKNDIINYLDKEFSNVVISYLKEKSVVSNFIKFINSPIVFEKVKDLDISKMYPPHLQYITSNNEEPIDAEIEFHVFDVQKEWDKYLKEKFNSDNKPNNKKNEEESYTDHNYEFLSKIFQDEIVEKIMRFI